MFYLCSSIKKFLDCVYIILVNKTDIPWIIFCYIKNNPSAIKENVVVAFIKKPGYSRKPVFRAIKRLEHKHHLILIEPDKANRWIHHLLINRENELGSLIVDLDSFKQAYIDLIDKTNSFLNDNHVVFTGIKGLVENLKLVNAILYYIRFILAT
jgi:hypothetical protein